MLRLINLCMYTHRTTIIDSSAVSCPLLPLALNRVVFTVGRRTVDGHDPAEDDHGGGIRRVPRHALEGEEFRRVRGHAQPDHEPVLQYRQRAHLGRGAQRAHGFQHRLRRQEVPREERLVLLLVLLHCQY